MNTKPNIGYYVPYGRDFLSSHTLSTLTFDATGMWPMPGQKNIGSFCGQLAGWHQAHQREPSIPGTKMQTFPDTVGH